MSVITVTKENFDQEVIQAKNKVLLDFWAPWCGPCRMLAPIVEEIAEEDESITLGKINVDEQMELAIRFGVNTIPTLVVMDGGKAVAQSVGVKPKDDILKMLG